MAFFRFANHFAHNFRLSFDFVGLGKLKKAFLAPIFVMTLSLLIETAESFALRSSYLSTYVSRHHMCSRRSLAPVATVLTTSHGTPSLGFFPERVRKNGGALVAKIDTTFGLFLINLIHCSPL